MKVKISTLEGALLDYAVAVALGKKTIIANGKCRVMTVGKLTSWFIPSTNWRIGGPLIEHHRIRIDYEVYPTNVLANAGIFKCVGPTILIAAMRTMAIMLLTEDAVLLEEEALLFYHESAGGLMGKEQNASSILCTT